MSTAIIKASQTFFFTAIQVTSDCVVHVIFLRPFPLKFNYKNIISRTPNKKNYKKKLYNIKNETLSNTTKNSLTKVTLPVAWLYIIGFYNNKPNE